MQALKSEPLLRMKATGELFIVKTTLLQCGCPAPHCPDAGCRHMQIPNQCLLWWMETGWKLMGWHQSTANIDSGVVKEKISQFRRIFRQRNKSFSEGSSQDDTFVPPIASTSVQKRNERQEGSNRPAANVSLL